MVHPLSGPSITSQLQFSFSLHTTRNIGKSKREEKGNGRQRKNLVCMYREWKEKLKHCLSVRMAPAGGTPFGARGVCNRKKHSTNMFCDNSFFLFPKKQSKTVTQNSTFTTNKDYLQVNTKCCPLAEAGLVMFQKTLVHRRGRSQLRAAGSFVEPSSRLCQPAT